MKMNQNQFSQMPNNNMMNQNNNFQNNNMNNMINKQGFNNIINPNQNMFNVGINFNNRLNMNMSMNNMQNNNNKSNMNNMQIPSNMMNNNNKIPQFNINNNKMNNGVNNINNNNINLSMNNMQLHSNMNIKNDVNFPKRGIQSMNMMNTFVMNNAKSNNNSSDRLPKGKGETYVDPFANYPGDRINIIFQTPKGHKTTISAPLHVTVHEVLVQYIRKLGLGPAVLYDGFYFLYNGAKLSVKDEKKISQ